MDEELIWEVEHHAIIYNRQKYFLNNVGPGRYETKDEAWNSIAMKLGTDVETCKKRWKYLRERYVQTRKHGEPPTYEHLSRPYLEKMKFLDQHIQPRKSYRNVSSYLPSPNATFGEYMDSRSNGSMNNMIYPNYSDSLVSIKNEPESFQNFASVNRPSQRNESETQEKKSIQASIQNIPNIPNQQQPPPQQHPPQQHPPQQHLPQQQLPQQNQPQPLPATEFRENDIVNIPSSSSSMMSPLSSPQGTDQQDISDSMKRPRLLPNHRHTNDYDSSDNDEASPSSQRKPQSSEQMLNEMRIKNGRISTPYPNNDFLYSVHQHQRFAPQNHIRCSEQLLGELVTTELLKMNIEKRKIAKRRILEVLFFDD